MAKDILMKVMDANNFIISSENWNTVSANSDKRRLIVKELNKRKFGISPEVVTSDRLNPGGQKGKSIIAGAVPVRCYYDGTDNTGKIEHGKPVVFDTVKGFGVTGINPKWTIDEYKVIGTALYDYSGTGDQGGMIYMQFEELRPLKGNLFCKAKGPDGYQYPDIEVWSNADPGSPDQHFVWPFELPSEISYNSLQNPANWTGSGQFVYGYNTTRQYVAKESLVLLMPAGEQYTQYYCEHWMFPSAVATLEENLIEGESAYAILDELCRQGIQGTRILVDDYMLEGNKMLSAGTKVMVTLYRYSNVSNDWVWRFSVVQAIKCPEDQPEE